MFRELSDLVANREQQLVGRAAQARSLLTSTDGASYDSSAATPPD